MKFLNQKGVSLPEVLIAVAIMAVMSVVFFPSYTAYKKRKSMELARVQIIGDLRKVQNYALSTVLNNDGNFPENGYGIHFDSSSGNNDEYIIFSDLDSGNVRRHDPGENFEVIELPEGIVITDISVEGVSIPQVDYLVSPPYGVVYINAQNKVSDNVISMSLSYSNGFETESITLKSSGYIN